MPNRRLNIELLEDRRLLTVNVSPLEQLTLELVNRARANPGAEAIRLGVGLNSGLAPGTITTNAKAPLAPNQILTDVAGAHSADMLSLQYFAHNSKNGTTPSQRAEAAGYPNGVLENIGIMWSSGAINPVNLVQSVHKELFKSATHRLNTMSTDVTEVGIGVRQGLYQGNNSILMTQDFSTAGETRFITGVAFLDNLVSDDFYTVQSTNGTLVSEGRAGVTIKATNIDFGFVFQTTTGTSGGYSLPVPNGSYVVTASGGGIQTTTLTNVVVNGQNVKLDFGDRQVGSVAGSVFNDLNGNASQATGEPFLAGWTVYVDQNGNGQRDLGELQNVTNASGQYSFASLAAGVTYTLRLELKPGFSQTSPTSSHLVSLLANQSITGRSFGVFTPASISGVVFHDLSRNESQGAGEPGQAGWQVYIDANNNGVKDSTELSTTTAFDGFYRFAGLLAGTRIVRVVIPAGWEQIAPNSSYRVDLASGQNVTGRDFAMRNLSRQLALSGTPGNDTFVFRAGANPTVELNGLLYAFSSGPLTIDFNGLAGTDTVELHGAAGKDTVTMQPGSARMVGVNYLVSTINTETVRAFSGGGTEDSVNFYDSPGNDVFNGRGHLRVSEMRGGGFTNTASGFVFNQAYASSGIDEANLYDTTAVDQFVVRSHLNDAYMNGGGIWNVASGFDRVSGFSNAGGSDTAIFFDTAGDDRFFVNAIRREAIFVGGGITSTATGFSKNSAHSNSGGVDVVDFNDSSQDDLFYGRGSYARMTGAGLVSEAFKFKRVRLSGLNGGVNRRDVSAFDYVFSSKGNWIV